MNMMQVKLRGLIPLLALYATVPALAQEAGWVVLPVNEYVALKIKATPQPPDPAKPPADAVITRIDYTLRVQDQSASGKATLNVDVFKTGWVKVAIPAGIYVRQASLNGKPVPIVSGAIILSSPGRSTINLEVIIPLITNASGQRLNLAPIAAGITQASLLLPKQDLEVKVTGGQLSSQSDVGADTKLQAFAFGSEPLSFIWRKSVQENKVALPLRQRGVLTQIVSLGEDGTSIFAEIGLEVTQGAATQMKIQVPPNVTINQVQGTLISDWEVKSGELAVGFLEPVERSAQFVVTGETILPREGTVDVPLLRLIDVERESGGLAVDVLGAGELKDIKSQGLERADASELGATVSSRQSPSLAAFRFRSAAAPRTLTVQVARYTPQAVLTAPSTSTFPKQAVPSASSGLLCSMRKPKLRSLIRPASNTPRSGGDHARPRQACAVSSTSIKVSPCKINCPYHALLLRLCLVAHPCSHPPNSHPNQVGEIIFSAPDAMIHSLHLSPQVTSFVEEYGTPP